MTATPILARARAARTGCACALAVLALVAGCSAEAQPLPSNPPAYTAPPFPAQAVTIPPNAPIPPPDAERCANPTASLRPTGEGKSARGKALDAIRARGRLIVGLDTGSNLFSFRDPISGVIVGFDADIAREVARDLLGSPDLVEYHTLSSAERIEALKNHDVDMVAKTMTITCERRQSVTFSTVYVLAHQRVLAVKDSGVNSIEDLAGKRVCIVGGTTSIDHIRQIQPTATILTVPTWADCLVVLQQRQADAVSTDDAVLAGLAAQDPYTTLIGGSISEEPYGIGIPKGDDDLVRFVNGTLERLRGDGTWTALYNRWLPVLGPTPPPPTPIYLD
ncbi:glutamate ABC transporter substrate-binding protein [Nocardia callitridis]|uniref:Glutamate ABC transporter substrate-binding protein n=1 Tax=Nocardia callitridis TaxID=648753 RepID=A0ABP9JVX3_9NOCA